MSVWNYIADMPPEAENLRVRSELMMAIEKQITERGGPKSGPPKHWGSRSPG